MYSFQILARIRRGFAIRKYFEAVVTADMSKVKMASRIGGICFSVCALAREELRKLKKMHRHKEAHLVSPFCRLRKRG